MSTRLALRIQDRLGGLTRSERKLAAVILDVPTLIETHTATELAARAGVSKATAARFFRALGYTDFEEAKLQAREERNRTEPFAYEVASSQDMPLGRMIGEHLLLELVNLTRTFEETDPDDLRRAARLVANAPQLWLLSLGADAWMAHYGRALFTRFRADVQIVDTADGGHAADLAVMGPRDVLIVLARGQQPREVKPILSYARTARASTIVLADHANLARLGRFCDVTLHCHIASYGIVPSHTSIMGMLRLLAVSYVGLTDGKAAQRAALIDEISDELRNQL